MKTKGGVVGGHGEEEQKLLPCLSIVKLQAVIIDDGVNVSERPKQNSRRHAVVRAEEREGDKQFAPYDLIRDVGKVGEVGRVVGFDFSIPQGVVVFSGQVLQTRTEEAQLDGHAQVQKATKEFSPMCRTQHREPAVNIL